MTNNITHLTNFGRNFQSKVVTLLLVDGKFLQTVYDIIYPEMFDSDANAWIVKYIISFYEKYMVIPTLDVMKVEVNRIEDEILQVSVIEHLKRAWQYRESPDLSFISDELIQFCKNQALKNAIVESMDLLEVQDYDGIKTLVDNAMKAGEQREMGHNYIEGLDERLTKSARDTLQTPWVAINDLMDGGLGKGELGVVVAPAGIGKCVGGDTKIDIEYEKIGFQINDTLVLWFDPWDVIEVNDNLKFRAFEVEKLLAPSGIDKTI